MQSPAYTRVFCEDIKIPAFVSRLPAACDLLPFIITNKPGAGSIFDSSHVTLSSRAAAAGGTPSPAAPPRARTPGDGGDRDTGVRGRGWGRGPPGAGSRTRLPPALPGQVAAGTARQPAPARGRGCRRAGGNEHIYTHGTGRRRNTRNTIYCIHQVLLAGRNEARIT